jgi:3-dehydroquinate synthase
MYESGGEGYRVPVSVGGSGSAGKYDIYIGPGLLDEAGRLVLEACPAHRYAVVSDSRVADLYGERLLAALGKAGGSATLFRFAAGEWNKTRATWGELTDGMLRAEFGRDSAVVALGGGVVGDVAGFVAATYMRGLPVVQIPTTLLAMLDSSVGGKTGVDTAVGKNLVGTFHQPSLVVIDPALLTTLPDPQLFSGLAEAFKHGLILDAGYFERLAGGLGEIARRESQTLAEVIARSVEIKAEVVGRDEREAGYRRILNFGHTIAHAQEAISGYGWLHGEAVAAGMALEAAIGEAMGVTEAGTAERIRDVMMTARLPVELDADVDPERFFKVLALDKKREGGRARYTLLERIGCVAGSPEHGWTHEVEEEVVGSVVFG